MLKVFFCILASFVSIVFAYPLSAEQAVFVVRHGERVDKTVDSPLSEAGQKRALALFYVLKDVGIRAIYTSQLQRTIKTAEPLAKILKIDPVPVTRSEDKVKTSVNLIDQMVDPIRQGNQSDAVLIVYHHTEIPDIIRKFGCRSGTSIREDEYDNLFVLILKGNECLMTLNLKYNP